MAERGFSLKEPMSGKDQRTALFGWGAGAFLAIGMYIGALQLYPESPSVSLVSSAATQAADPIMTGSIGSAARQSLPHLSVSLEMRLDHITMELADIREALASAQASTLSANRRIEALEDSTSLFTASVARRATEAADQPLPQAIAALASQMPAPSTEQPVVMSVDGGRVEVAMRPLEVEPQVVEEVQAALEEVQLLEQASDVPEMVMISQTPFAVDVGGARTLEEIDRLWLQLRQTYDGGLDELTPRILLQQTSDGQLDLRLVAGPISDAADAAMLCARLVAAGLPRCLPAVFDGQQLAMRSSSPF